MKKYIPQVGRAGSWTCLSLADTYTFSREYSSTLLWLLCFRLKTKQIFRASIVHYVCTWWPHRQYLLLERLDTRGLSLLFVDSLHQHTLVLELVTLASQVTDGQHSPHFITMRRRGKRRHTQVGLYPTRHIPNTVETIVRNIALSQNLIFQSYLYTVNQYTCFSMNDYNIAYTLGRTDIAKSGPDLQLMIQVLVDFFSFTVLAEHAAKDSHAALPDELEGQTSVSRTPTLTRSSVPSLPARMPCHIIFKKESQRLRFSMVQRLCFQNFVSGITVKPLPMRTTGCTSRVSFHQSTAYMWPLYLPKMFGIIFLAHDTNENKLHGKESYGALRKSQAFALDININHWKNTSGRSMVYPRGYDALCDVRKRCPPACLVAARIWRSQTRNISPTCQNQRNSLFCLVAQIDAGARVHNCGQADHQSILHQLHN